MRDVFTLFSRRVRKLTCHVKHEVPALPAGRAAFFGAYSTTGVPLSSERTTDALIAARHAAATARADAAAAAFSDADFDIDRPVRGLPVKHIGVDTNRKWLREWTEAPRRVDRAPGPWLGVVGSALRKHTVQHVPAIGTQADKCRICWQTSLMCSKATAGERGPTRPH